VLAQAELSVDDIDAYEVNEAFACVVPGCTYHGVIEKRFD
jgi:acetyl-CoA acetyltransferase